LVNIEDQAVEQKKLIKHATHYIKLY